jgi:hypothetical protein
MPKVKSEKKFRTHKNQATTNAAVGQKQGIQFNKDFGQHILKNPLIITSMIDKVNKLIFFLFTYSFYSALSIIQYILIMAFAFLSRGVLKF